MTRTSGLAVTARTSRQYDPDGRLRRDDGSVPLAEAPVARRLAARMNEARATGRAPGAPTVQAGELHALGLIHDVFHHLVEQYESDARPGAFADGVAAVRSALGSERAAALLDAFAAEFPAAASSDAPHRLEELLLTWLANVNPAVEPLRDIVDDRSLATATDYPAAIEAIEAFFEAEPGFGPDGESLVALLRAPALASPTSLAGQLRYIRERWAPLLGSLLDRLLVALDVIAEEERALHLRFGGGAAQGGFGGRVDLPSFGSLDEEPERFSSDSDWMPRLVLIAKSTYVWLDQLSRRYGRDIRTLDAVPDEELDRLASWGITGLWLIGLWQRSQASERIKRMRGNPDAVASAYSLDDYRIADDLGGEGAFEALKARAWSRGIRMASDMVPNHMGIDSRWVIEHPEWFLSLAEPPYPGYSYGGPDLSSDERVGIFLEDHYWDNSDAAVVFRRLDRWTGENRYVYHGNDGTSFPWNDTAQLDFLKAEVREQVIRTIIDVARRSPVIRFDAAMVLAKRHVRRLWYPEPGSGGAIPSRAEHGAMSAAEFDRLMPTEFWREVVDRVAAEVPDTLLLAEAFWMLEGYFVRTLGMHRVYNSAFMHMLRDENNAGYRTLIKETLEFDPEILKRYVNFMNNPDERTAVEQFGKGDKYFGVAMLMATMPGLPMIGHGQVEGFGEKYGMEFRRATLDEQPDPWLVERHEREIFPLLHRRSRFAGASDFLLYDFVRDDGAVDENVFAYSNGRDADRSLVIYHNQFGSTAGWIRESVPYAVKEPDGTKRLVRRTLADGLGLPPDPDLFVAFRDARSGLEYLRHAPELRGRGLYVRLDAYQGHVFWELRELHDGVSGQWRRIADRLAGRGVASLEEALRELQLEPVHEPLRALVSGPLVPLVRDGEPPADDAARDALLRFADAVAGATGVTASDGAGYAQLVTHRLAALASSAAFLAPHGLDNVARRAVLVGWAVLEPLGRLAPGAIAGPTSRAWYDELRLGPVVAAAFRSAGLDEGGAWRAAERARSLIALPRPSNVSGRSAADRAARLVDAWLGHPDVRPFIRINAWEGVEWFGREEWRELLEWTRLLDRLDGADAKRTEAVLTLLAAAGDASAYRVDALRSAVKPAVSPRRGRPTGAAATTDKRSPSRRRA